MQPFKMVRRSPAKKGRNKENIVDEIDSTIEDDDLASSDDSVR